MEKAFAYAEERKCSFAFVETMSFQALEFYENVALSLNSLDQDMPITLLSTISEKTFR